ncbi:MAG TPA: ATP-binding protein, partial [Alphaproteobacteria bacterium]|nr:ATP-binding protein [Alphaproteobacteria bacterium]
GPRWLLVTVERIVFDGRAAFLWWFFDITDQKTTEIALRDSEMQLALVMSGTNDGIWDLDLRTRRLRHSPRYFTMLGYEEQAVAGMLERGEDEFLAMVHPGDLSGLLAAANAHLRGETAAFEAAFRMRRRDGGWAWILSRGRAMPGPDGTPVRFVGAHTDITAQKRAEDELRQAMDVADSANRAKTNFLAMMSHEIRTPMNGVMGLLELLAATPLNDDQGELVQVVQESTTSLLQIIDDILDFSKIEAGRMQIDQVPVSPLALVESVAEALAPAAHKRRLALACYVAPDVPELVNGDPVRLRQVIYNLLGNAIKFTERGHVQVTVARAVGTDGAPALRFAVEDTGIGLAEDVRQRLFQPFTQADSSTTRRFGGTGLGLSISRRLVEMMGGTIGVESRLGEGSTFWFTLRLDAGASGAAANIDLSGVRVLLGEDEAPSRAAIRLYLEQCGAAVELADGGLDAMAKIHGAAAAGRPYDVALIDYDVLAECPTLAMVLADPAVNGTRGVQLSGLDGDGRRQLPADGFFAQLTKPVHRNALRQTVAVAAGRLPAGTLQGVGAAAPPAIRPPSRAQALAAGTLILVAEDNPTNQFVVRRQLGQLGFCADVVDDGAAALAAWRETGYGLVLTDLHMPHMDGVELTRAIRAAEGDSGRRVPIVALTANALAGEANRCLAAGMDDYLSKPVNLAQLDRALRRWLTPGDGSEADAGPVPPLPAASDAPADAPDAPVALAQLIELFGAIDDDARDMLFLFLSTTEPLFDEMEAALARGDFAAGKGAAHTAKGASRSAAALPLGELCYAIETAMRAGDAEAGAALLPQARAEFQRVAAFIRAL